MERGDVLIQGDDPHSRGTHALMWVGGDKALIHSSNDGFLGVLQQSMGFFGKYVPQELNKTVSVGAGVYRYVGEVKDLGAKAAGFAEKWATRPDDVNKDGLDHFKQRVLRTPFSARRLGAAEKRRVEGGQAVSVETIFRVLKAIARGELQSSLSPNHGVSCSQFVVYCYQAASLSLKIGDVLPAPLLEKMKGKPAGRMPPDASLDRYTRRDMQEDDGPAGVYWRDKGWWAEQGVFRKVGELARDEHVVSLLKMTLKHDQGADYYKSLLPPGMNIDPLSYGVGYLLSQLKAGGSSFKHLGYLHGTRREPGANGAITWDIRADQ